MECPKIDPYICGQLIFNKDVQVIVGGKMFFSEMTGTFGQPYEKIMNLDSCIVPCTKSHSQWVIKLTKHKTIKFLEENLE